MYVWWVFSQTYLVQSITVNINYFQIFQSSSKSAMWIWCIFIKLTPCYCKTQAAPCSKTCMYTGTVMGKEYCEDFLWKHNWKFTCEFPVKFCLLILQVLLFTCIFYHTRSRQRPSGHRQTGSRDQTHPKGTSIPHRSSSDHWPHKRTTPERCLLETSKWWVEKIVSKS